MSFYDWDDISHEIGALAGSPKPAILAAQIAPSLPLDEEFERRVFQVTGLPGIPLEEISIQDLLPDLLPFLKSVGSHTIYVAGRGDEDPEVGNFQSFDLSEHVCAQVMRDSVLELPCGIVDDQRVCAIVTWFSDYTLLCMREDLADQYLARHPLDLTLYEDGPRYPLARSLAEAQRLANRRIAEYFAELERRGRPTRHRPARQSPTRH